MEKKSSKSAAPKVVENPPKRLVRSSTDKIIAGVCGGLALYFELDPIIFRILFAIAAFTGGSGLLIYIVLWIVMPEESDSGKDHKDVIEKNAKQVGQKFEETVESIDTPKGRKTMRLFFGIAVMFFGVYLLLLNFGLERYVNLFWYIGKMWPLFVIALGLYILVKQNDEK